MGVDRAPSSDNVSLLHSEFNSCDSIGCEQAVPNYSDEPGYSVTSVHTSDF